MLIFVFGGALGVTIDLLELSMVSPELYNSMSMVQIFRVLLLCHPSDWSLGLGIEIICLLEEGKAYHLGVLRSLTEFSKLFL